MTLRIKQVCKDNGITYIELAKSIGISRQALDKRIKNNPTIESLSEIAKFLNVDVIELIEPGKDFAHFYADGEWLGVRKK